jgi:hypothetical protein
VGERRRIVQAILFGAIALTGVLISSRGDAGASHLLNTTTRWSIDADTTGNAAASLGVLDRCVEAATGTDVAVDVTVEDIPAVNTQGTPEIIDDTGGIIGYHLQLQYDASALSVDARETGFLLYSAPGGNPFIFSDDLPDTDGSYELDASDLGVGPGSTESGSGVLVRLTLHVGGSALPNAYTLTLAESAHLDSQNSSFAAPIVYSAQIAVGVPCPGPTMVGDVDCSGAVNAVDALKVLRFGAALSVDQTEPCNDPGSQSPQIGDVDCSLATNSVDALKILRFGAGLGYAKVHYCDGIGT